MSFSEYLASIRVIPPRSPRKPSGPTGRVAECPARPSPTADEVASPDAIQAIVQKHSVNRPKEGPSVAEQPTSSSKEAATPLTLSERMGQLHPATRSPAGNVRGQNASSRPDARSAPSGGRVAVHNPDDADRATAAITI